MSFIDSFEHSLSSSDKENVKPRRKRTLDDALFQFFRKEAIKSLRNPENVSNVDICLLVYEHIMDGVSKFSTTCKLNGRKPKEFEFCYYILGVYYLDSLDFGARLIDQSLLRILVWNGNMIKFFSELDHPKKNIFGKRRLKKNLARCYREQETVNEISHGPFVAPCFSTGFKENLHFRFDNAPEAKAAALANVDKSTKCELNVLGKIPELDKTACAPTARIPAMNSGRVNHLQRNHRGSKDKVHVSLPISRLNFSESPILKDSDGSKDGVRLNANRNNNATITITSSPKPHPVLQSLEVQITGYRSSSLKQVDAGKSLDDLYNSMANIHGNKDIQPSSSEKQAVDLAYTLGVQKSCAVQFSKVHCSYISLGQSLQREGHVDNFLIPLFCQKLFEDNRPSKSLRHHFFLFIGESSKGKRLEFSDRLFFAICRSRHWFTFYVDFKYKLFVFLESLYNKEDDFHTSIKNLIIKNFVTVWKIVFKTDENIFNNFGIIYPHVPKQDNGDDCGVYTMKFMKTFRPDLDMRRLFGKEDILHIRIQYANELYFCPRNVVDKSLVLDFPAKVDEQVYIGIMVFPSLFTCLPKDYMMIKGLVLIPCNIKQQHYIVKFLSVFCKPFG
ncbi:unnamed protein product [Alopecurus aequalis]